MLKAILLVSIGGAVGSSMRYLTSVFMHKWVSQLYPWGTFIANMLGCFLIGIIMSLCRVSLGRHFLSDVFWSMFITIIAAFYFYRLIFGAILYKDLENNL